MRLVDTLEDTGLVDQAIASAKKFGIPVASNSFGNRRAELVRLLTYGHLHAFCEARPFEGPSLGQEPVPNEILAPLYRSYTTSLGMDAGTSVAAPTKGHQPQIPAAAAVPPPENGKPLKDRKDDQCPATNYRSESIDSALPEVVAWLKDPGGMKTAQKQNKVLGAEGGGGFLITTTRISSLKAGTVLYRYFDQAGGAGNDGGWWTTELVVGDPRRTLALPEPEPGFSNSARSMARSRLGSTITALTGVGAPRCSGKPGGPQQWYIAWSDRAKGVLRDPDDASKPLPPGV